MIDFEDYLELGAIHTIEDPDEPDLDYDYDATEWDTWTDEEIQEFLAEDLADEMRLQAIIERGEAE